MTTIFETGMGGLLCRVRLRRVHGSMGSLTSVYRTETRPSRPPGGILSRGQRAAQKAGGARNSNRQESTSLDFEKYCNYCKTIDLLNDLQLSDRVVDSRITSIVENHCAVNLTKNGCIFYDTDAHPPRRDSRASSQP